MTHCGDLPHADDDGRLDLRTCPFHFVAPDHRDVVCGLNLRLVEGVIAGCGHPLAPAELDPAPDRCCVVVHDAQPSARGRRRRRPHPAVPADREAASTDRPAP